MIVLCYFNAGAVQYTDCDWSKWKTDGLFNGKIVANYDQEKYVDVTDETAIELQKARIDLAHSIGCDGIDPDNIDTYVRRSGISDRLDGLWLICETGTRSR